MSVTLKVIRAPRSIQARSSRNVICIACRSRRCTGRCHFVRKDEYHPPKGA